MNLQKVREAEARDAAQELITRIIDAHASSKSKQQTDWQTFRLPTVQMDKAKIKSAGSIGAQGAHYAPELSPIISILKAHIRGTPLSEIGGSPDIDAIRNLLNKRIKTLETLTITAGQFLYLIPHGSRFRFAAEALLRYLWLYIRASLDTPMPKPFALCPACDGIFLIQREGQVTCSAKCRFEAWRKKDPEYWKHRYAKSRKKV